MKSKQEKSHPTEGEKGRVEEAWERKFFPRSFEKKKQEQAMRDPKLFEERLKEKLQHCMKKKQE
jgi:hypothetical protein